MNIQDSCQEDGFQDDRDVNDAEERGTLCGPNRSAFSEIDTISMTLELMMNKKYYRKGFNQKSQINKYSEITENTSSTILVITNDLLGKLMNNNCTDEYRNNIKLAFENYVAACLDHIANKKDIGE